MDYQFVRTSTAPDKIKQYSKLLSDVFPETKKYTVDFLTWQYQQNPSGEVVGYDAYYGDLLVAHYVALPLEFSFNGNSVKGVLALNVATHVEHRGKSLFTKLAALTYDLAAELGYKFVTGVANQNTTNGYVTRLGFITVIPLEVKLYLGTPKLNAGKDNYIKEIWSKEKVQWRLRNPEAVYHSNSKCLVCGTHIKFIDAVLSERNEFNIADLSHKSCFIKMSIGINLANCQRMFSIALPDKLKPSPLNLIFKPLGDFKMEVNKNNLFFELIDFDAY